MKYEGIAGTAEKVADTKGWPTTVAGWLLTCPGQSPAWDHYCLGIVHLREHEGVPPAKIAVPGATHELLLYALDPTGIRGVAPTVGNPEEWVPLTPINLVMQLELPSDEAADRLCELAARAVCDGITWAEPPLSGQVEPWRTQLLKTAAHLRGEEHAP